MRIIEEESKVTYEFDGLVEMATWTDKNKRPNGYVHKYERTDFCKETFKEAVDYSIHGNRKRTKKFQGVLQNVKSLIQTERATNLHDVTGEMIDIGCYLTGQPECFVRKMSTPDKPVIKIAVCMSLNCAQKQENIERRGAGIVALVDELQAMGYVVEVYIHHICSPDEKPRRLCIKTKVACNPIDTDEFASICATSFQRRLSFALLEIYTECDHPAGYAIQKEMGKTELDEEGVDFYFSGDTSGYYSEQRVKDIILQMMDKREKQEEKHVISDRYI